MLVAESLHIQRGEGKDIKIILNGSPDCGFIIEAGKLVYLAGASGLGKSTLLWTLARLHPLRAGVLRLNGKCQSELSVTSWRADIALLPQKSVIMPGTVADNLLYPFSLSIQQKRLKERSESLPDSEDLQENLESVGLYDIPLERKANSLSGGQQARLALLRVLLTKPQIILADEPTAGLDNVAATLVFNRLNKFCETGGAVIFTSHQHGERFEGARIMLDGKGGLKYIYEE